MISTIRDKAFWIILIFASIYILGNIGSGSLTTWDEGVYACVSKEMATDGDWLIPHHMGKPWFDKPPLYMWVTGVFYRFFGINEFSTRLGSGIFGILSVMLVYIFVKEIISRRAAMFSAIMLLGMPHFLNFSKAGTMDVSITFFILLMIYFFWKGQNQKIFLLPFR